MSRRRKPGRVIALAVAAVLLTLVALMVLVPAVGPRTSQFVRCVPPTALTGPPFQSANA